MVREKYLDKFHVLVRKLWSFLKEHNPKDKETLNKQVYKKIRNMDPVKYLEYTLNNLEPHIKLIVAKDDMLFTPEYTKNSKLEFLLGYDFIKFVKNTNLDKKAMNEMYYYLIFMFIQASKALEKNQEIVEQIVDMIKMEDELEKEAVDNPNAFDDEGGNISDIFAGNELLSELVNDIKNDLDLDSIIKEIMEVGEINPGTNIMETAANLSKNPRILNIIKDLQEKMGKRFSEKNVTSKDLQESSDTLMKNLEKQFKNIPGGKQIVKMLKQMDTDKLMKQFDHLNNQKSTIPTNTNDTDQNNSNNIMLEEYMKQLGSNEEIQALFNNMENLSKQSNTLNTCDSDGEPPVTFPKM